MYEQLFLGKNSKFLQHVNINFTLHYLISVYVGITVHHGISYRNQLVYTQEILPKVN